MLDEAKSHMSKIPSVLIRSAAECDEEDKSFNLDQPPKSAPTYVNGSKLDRQSKSHQFKDFLIDSLSSASDQTNARKSKPSKKKEESNVGLQRPEGDEKEARNQLSPETLKLGTKVTARVHQVRALGLVLDLGGGIRGMYRFEVGVIVFILLLFGLGHFGLNPVPLFFVHMHACHCCNSNFQSLSLRGST